MAAEDLNSSAWISIIVLFKYGRQGFLIFFYIEYIFNQADGEFLFFISITSIISIWPPGNQTLVFLSL